MPDLVSAGARQQVQLLGPPNGRPAIVHPELAVDVFGVGAHGIQRHCELTGDLWTGQFAAKQPQHINFV